MFDTGGTLVRASVRDGYYPRPQLVRRLWCDLSGQWSFSYDDLDLGLSQNWRLSNGFQESIQVPFPPESEASGLGITDYHSVVWYQRVITAAELLEAGLDHDRPIVRMHFGACDYSTIVWANGEQVGSHRGGHTPFTVELPVGAPSDDINVVIRIEDDPVDPAQPRGKQDWESTPHEIWYKRTTGIWGLVWLEAVPLCSIDSLWWKPTESFESMTLVTEYSSRPTEPATLALEVFREDECVYEASVRIRDRFEQHTFHLTSQRHSEELRHHLWSPDNPALFDARITVRIGDGTEDVVYSYFGIRTVGTSEGKVLLNGRPFFLRGVLSQGYRGRSHLAQDSVDSPRRDVQLIKAMGFNSVRLHQKVEDPNFLYWADRLGLAVWAEFPAAYSFDDRAIRATMTEWAEAIVRDRSHPAILTWVPMNESWGVAQIATEEHQRNFQQALYYLTKSLDPTRLVVGNDGWEHVKTDVLSVHDYRSDPEEVQSSYSTSESVKRLVSGYLPSGRLASLGDYEEGLPVVVSEFGGIRLSSSGDGSCGSWGYVDADSDVAYRDRLAGLFAALNSSGQIAGYFYTQFVDTEQESNGLISADGTPKLPLREIEKIVRA